MDTSQYLDAFLAETQDNLDTLNELCLALEQGRADDDTFAALFRAAHTLKGMSATMGYGKMADLTHHMEDALGYFRQHPEQFSDQVVDVLFTSIDALAHNLDVIREGSDESVINHSAVLKQLQEVAEGANQMTASASQPSQFSNETVAMLSQLETTGEMVGVIEVEFEKTCMMKGVRMVMVMRAVEAYGDCVATVPEVTELEEGNFEGPVQVAVLVHNGSMEDLRDEIAQITEVARVQIVDLKPSEPVSTAETQTAASLIQGEASPVQSGPSTEGTERGTTTARSREQTLRVPVSRIDEFMNVLSELVIAKTRLELLAKERDDADFREVSERIARLSDALQDGIMSMRMMPVESLFQRFPRMMRDIQKTLDREFDFQMTGLETEMDRTVMDEMGEALVHLLRNAADHGLESPNERERVGKPRRGTIRLSAYASGGHVYLEVADDGGGIHRDKVLKSAISKGIVDPDKGSTMSDTQVFDLLFASGFSTAATISDISGRGVGLDAVRGKVESLGGTIRIESVVGRGSTFIIELPLTLTILQSMLVRIGGEVFALPTNTIEEVARLTAEEFQFVHERPVIKYREKVVPVLDLRETFFQEPRSGEYPWQVVICREGKRYLALVVDDIIDELEVVNKPMGKFLEGVTQFSGATILGDGHVALIVDIHQFFQVMA